MVKWFKKKTNETCPTITQQQPQLQLRNDVISDQQHTVIPPTNYQQLILTPQQQMIMTMPVFGGQRHESFNNFVNEMEIKLNNDNLNDQQQMDIMVQRLHGNASNELLKFILSTTTPLKYIHIINHLQQIFPEPQATTFQTIRRRKQQPGETVEEYAAEIRQLVNKFFTNQNGYNSTSREHKMIHFFINNSNPQLKKHLKQQQCYNNLNDVVNEATKFKHPASPESSLIKTNAHERRGPSFSKADEVSNIVPNTH